MVTTTANTSSILGWDSHSSGSQQTLCLLKVHFSFLTPINSPCTRPFSSRLRCCGRVRDPKAPTAIRSCVSSTSFPPFLSYPGLAPLTPTAIHGEVNVACRAEDERKRSGEVRGGGDEIENLEEEEIQRGRGDRTRERREEEDEAEGKETKRRFVSPLCGSPWTCP
eukprot:347050-Hanusia_phi.AAC.1